MHAIVQQATVFPNASAILMARIEGVDGTNTTQASLSSITIRVTDISVNPPVTTMPTTPLSISATVFDTPQNNDIRWEKDQVGFGFLTSVPPSAIPNGSHTYLAEVWFQPVSGNQFPAVWQLATAPILFGP